MPSPTEFEIEYFVVPPNVAATYESIVPVLHDAQELYRRACLGDHEALSVLGTVQIIARKRSGGILRP